MGERWQHGLSRGDITHDQPTPLALRSGRRCNHPSAIGRPAEEDGVVGANRVEIQRFQQGGTFRCDTVVLHCGRDCRTDGFPRVRGVELQPSGRHHAEVMPVGTEVQHEAQVRRGVLDEPGLRYRLKRG
jgi:hypothetical protein